MAQKKKNEQELIAPKAPETKFSTTIMLDEPEDVDAAKTAPADITKEESDFEAKPLPYKKSEYDRDHEMVRGVFKYFERPGKTLDFFYSKYKGDPTVTYHLTDGQTYELPRMVANHLNSSGKLPQYSHVPGDINAPQDKDYPHRQCRITHYESRVGFFGLDFGIAPVENRIVGVEMR